MMTDNPCCPGCGVEVGKQYINGNDRLGWGKWHLDCWKNRSK